MVKGEWRGKGQAFGGKFSPSPAAPNPFQTFLFAVPGAWRARDGKQKNCHGGYIRGWHYPSPERQ